MENNVNSPIFGNRQIQFYPLHSECSHYLQLSKYSSAPPAVHQSGSPATTSSPAIRMFSHFLSMWELPAVQQFKDVQPLAAVQQSGCSATSYPCGNYQLFSNSRMFSHYQHHYCYY
eukprot:GFUD01082360.1.p2 GENE.GFUD01082360.1~~GFUD01082360.1.p2  ORF type:complete len:116 (-),score=26.66 GFUD01082360.1:205-552(-)